MTRPRTLLGLGAAALLAASPAWAAPTLLRTAPHVDPATERLVIMVGGLREDGRALRALSVQASAGGAALPPPAVDQTLQEHAISGMQTSPTWRAPVAVGIVYLFVKGLSEPDKRGALPIIDGIVSYARQLPERVVIYPTPYGRTRQGRASVSKDDIARIGEGQPLENDRPNLGEAIRLNLSDLRADPGRLKVMLVVTDGRDYADPDMERSADFGVIGKELRDAGVAVQIVSFQPEADIEQAAVNLRDLRDATGAFSTTVDPEGLFPTLESLGQAVANVRRLEYPLPWSWRTFGGEKALSLSLRVDDRDLRLDGLAVTLPGRGGLLWAVGGGAGLLILGVGAALLLRGRGGAPRLEDRPRRRRQEEDTSAPGDEFPPVVVAAHDLVKRGVPAERAAGQLSARFPEQVADLLAADPEALPDELFPVFHTRAGRNRFEEVRRLLASPQGAGVQIPDRLFDILIEAVRGKLSVVDATNNAVARIPNRELKTFTSLRLEEVAELLRRSAARHPELGPPKARGVALALQDALRKRSSAVVSVGWLVCAAGPLRRGATLRLVAPSTVLGSGPGAALTLTDPSVLPEHARIDQDGDKFILAAAAGPVAVEGQPVAGPRVLVDGETLTLGRGQYIFKQATG